MIEFSYCLSRLENKRGTPERPLSDLGFRSYVSFWAITIIKYLLENEKVTKLTIQAISEDTCIDSNDVLYILENFKIIRKINNNQSQLYLKKEYLEALLEGLGVKQDQNGFKYPKYVHTDKIMWEPYKF